MSFCLAPFQFYDHLIAVLVDDVLGHTVAGVLDVHLHDDRPVAVIVPQERIDAPVQLRRLLDPAIVDDGLFVDTDNVLPDNDRNADEGGAGSKGIPILRGDEGGAEGARHDRHPGLCDHFRPEFGLNADVREDTIVRRALQSLRKAPNTVEIPLDPQRVVIHAEMGRVRAACRNGAEVSRVEDLPAFQARQERFASPFAVRAAQGTESRFRRIATVHGSTASLVLTTLSCQPP